ncbi:hypothetical protein Goarm_022836, partial [Gossypium armourianum]|nr:hypothetical protein [Gossypium armourianum]
WLVSAQVLQAQLLSFKKVIWISICNKYSPTLLFKNKGLTL